MNKRKKSKSPVAKLPRDQLPVVAITGRPNVGKSSIFNRLLKRRDALVFNTPGSHVTRDYKEAIGHFADLKFKIIDTSGLEPFLPKDSIQFRATRLTEKVLKKSDIVILVLDARAGLALLDQHLGIWLQEHTKVPILLVANKCENYTTDIESTLYESTELGLGMPIAMSAETGLGFSELYNSLRPIIDDIATHRLQKLKVEQAQTKFQDERESLVSKQFFEQGQQNQQQTDPNVQTGSKPHLIMSEPQPVQALLDEVEDSNDDYEDDKEEREEIGVDEDAKGMKEFERDIDIEYARQEYESLEQQMQQAQVALIDTSEKESQEDTSVSQVSNSRPKEQIEVSAEFVSNVSQGEEIVDEYQIQSEEELVLFDQEKIDKEQEWQEHMQDIQKEIDYSRQKRINLESMKRDITQQIASGAKTVKITGEASWDEEMEKIYEESSEYEQKVFRHFSEVDADKQRTKEQQDLKQDEDGDDDEEDLDEILEEDAERIHRLVSDGWVDPDAQKEKIREKIDQEEFKAEDGEDKEEPAKHVTLSSDYIRIAIMGLPNVGKSTLVNQLLGEERCLTGPEPGLTRDAVLTSFTHEEYKIDLIDTAGYMKRAKLDRFDDVGGRVAELTLFQGYKARNMSHVVVLVIDGYEVYLTRGGKPLSAKEISLVSQVFDEGRGLVIIANKMDLLSTRQKELIKRELTQQVEQQFQQVKDVRVIFTSALSGDGIQELMPAVVDTFKSWTQRVSTARINRWMQKLKVTYVGTGSGSGVPKVRYLTQVKARPPTFVVMFKRFHQVREDDCRHVRNVLRDAFGFQGVPLRVYARDNRADQLRRKFKGYKGTQKRKLRERLKEQNRLDLLVSKQSYKKQMERAKERTIKKIKKKERQESYGSKDPTGKLAIKEQAKKDYIARRYYKQKD